MYNLSPIENWFIHYRQREIKMVEYITGYTVDLLNFINIYALKIK